MDDRNVVWQSSKVSREQRPHRGGTLWITGLSGSGKSSVAIELERRLVAQGRPAYLMDGDNLRHGLNSDLGFGDEQIVLVVQVITRSACATAAGTVSADTARRPCLAANYAARPEGECTEMSSAP